MAAMLVITFGPHLASAWSVVVGAPTLWFILRALRDLTSSDPRALKQPVQQVLMCAAMLFMLVMAGRSASASRWTVTDRTDMPGIAMDSHSPNMVGSAASLAVTSFVLVGVLVLVAVRDTRHRIVAATSQLARPMDRRLDLRQRARALLLAPGLRLGSQLAMSCTMIYMLVLMV
jgi:hypothetical protein